MAICSVYKYDDILRSLQMLQWEQVEMTTFRDFVKLYNNKDLVPTLEAMQNIMKSAKLQNL